ncbi:hypothetical protein ACERK3_12270 [Phycisphaerales bacterium AB-hyl4]|uniref:Testis-expressed protein 13A/C/D zinc finger domain-containing protein n=1 Tax=Natronomicrosphaera hydrolytica TaxID=3242702 RepID=A0ABV4U7U7_9BACT
MHWRSPTYWGLASCVRSTFDVPWPGALNFPRHLFGIR